MIQNITNLNVQIGGKRRQITVALAYDGTFLVLVRSDQNSTLMHHLTSNGKSIHKYELDNVPWQFFMPDDSTVYFARHESDKILQVDLKSKKVWNWSYTFLDKAIDVSWYYFPESGLNCLREVNKIEELQGKSHFGWQLTYFKKDNLQNPIASIKFDKNRKHCVNMQKGNIHSLLIGCLQRSEKGQNLILVDLVTKYGKVEPRVREVTYPNRDSGSMFALSSQNIFIEYKQNELLSISNGTKDYGKMAVYNIEKDTLRHFDFQRPIVNQRVVLYSLGQFVAVLKNHKTYRYSYTSDSKYIHFISPALETVYYRQQLQEDQDWRTADCDYDPQVLLLYTVDKVKENIAVRLFKVSMPLKDIYMTMLLHLNEDFDDDLLQETIQLMVDL